MSHTTKDATAFNDALLRDIWEHLSAKRKSIRNRGKLEMESRADSKGEWLRVIFRRAAGPYVVVEVCDDHFADVYLQSARRVNRGKVLFRIKDIRLVGNARKIVECISETFEAADYSATSYPLLRQGWRSVSCEIVKS